MSHFFPEYGRFAFWTENLIKSQFYGPLWHLKVKCSILSFSPKLLKIKQKDKLYTNILSISWLLWKHNVFMKCQNLKIFKTVLKCFFSHLRARQSGLKEWYSGKLLKNSQNPWFDFGMSQRTIKLTFDQIFCSKSKSPIFTKKMRP